MTTLLLTSTAAFAQSSKRMLLTIGYSDFHPSIWDESGFGNYDYDLRLGLFSEAALLITLSEQGLACEATELRTAAGVLRAHVCRDTPGSSREAAREVVLLNANVRCPGEVASSNLLRAYRGECSEQREQSAAMKSFVESELYNFDAFIYLGHARGGQGISYTNKSERAEFVQLSELHVAHSGPSRLRDVVIAACDSERYYRRSFAQVFGTSGIRMSLLIGKPYWRRDLVPFVAGEIARLLR